MADSHPGDREGDVPVGALVPFLLVAFGIAWGLFALFMLVPDTVARLFGEVSARHPLFVLAVYAPAIAAVLAVLRWTGLAGFGRFLGRLGLWRAHGGWYVFLIAGIPLVYAAGAVLGGGPAGLKIPDGGWTSVLGAMAFTAILGPVEEIGWRGVAQPLLQRRLAPVWAGLVLGLIWGLWHLPAFFLAGTPQSNWTFLPFFAGAVAVSLIITPLFNRSGGSLLLPMLVHFQLNGPLWPDGQPWDTAVFAVVALAVVWICRDEMFRRGAGVTAVVPAPR